MVRSLVGLCALALLSGCAAAPQWTPGPVVTISASPAAATSGPSGAATDATPTAPALPDASGAIDANSYPDAHFASPSGRIWCALSAGQALCHFPNGMNSSKVPGSAEVCPDEHLDVTGVLVAADARYFCSGDPEALPQTDGSYVGWWKGSGLPSVTYAGQKLAVLPYGRKLAKGDVVCESEKAGVTCGNTSTGRGFRVALAGVVLIG